MTIKLADGVDFNIGMTVYLLVGGIPPDGNVMPGRIRSIKTSEDTHEIDSFEYEGRMCHCLQRKGSTAGTDIGCFYSSREAIIEACIGQLTSTLREGVEALTRLHNMRDELTKAGSVV